MKYLLETNSEKEINGNFSRAFAQWTLKARFEAVLAESSEDFELNLTIRI